MQKTFQRCRGTLLLEVVKAFLFVNAVGFLPRHWPAQLNQTTLGILLRPTMKNANLPKHP